MDFPFTLQLLSSTSYEATAYSAIHGIPENDDGVKNRLYLLRPLFIILHSIAALPLNNASRTLNIYSLTNGLTVDTTLALFIHTSTHGSLRVSAKFSAAIKVDVTVTQDVNFIVPKESFSGFNTLGALTMELMPNQINLQRMVFSLSTEEGTDLTLTWEGEIVAKSCSLALQTGRSVSAEMNTDYSSCFAECWAPARCSFICVDNPILHANILGKTAQ